MLRVQLSKSWIRLWNKIWSEEANVPWIRVKKYRVKFVQPKKHHRNIKCQERYACQQLWLVRSRLLWRPVCEVFDYTGQLLIQYNSSKLGCNHILADNDSISYVKLELPPWNTFSRRTSHIFLKDCMFEINLPSNQLTDILLINSLLKSTSFQNHSIPK